MAKEKKIGVMVIAALLAIFVTVVVMKFTGTNETAVAGENGKNPAAAERQEKPKLASGPTRAHYLTAEKDSTTAPAVRPNPSRAADKSDTTTDPPQWRYSATAEHHGTDGSDRYSGQYAGGSRTSNDLAGGTPTPAGEIGPDGVDPFQARSEQSGSTDIRVQLSADRRTPISATSLSPRPDTLAVTDSPALDQRNPLRHVQQPARLAGAELPVASSRRAGSQGGYRANSSLRTQASTAQRTPTGGTQTTTSRYSNYAPGAANHAVAGSTRQSAVQDPQYQQQYQRASDLSYDDPLESGREQQRISPGKYNVGPNDNYWTISARVYGTGKYFKSLFEHNRHRYPDADNLHVGDKLDVPEVAKLEELYPDLCPKRRRGAVQARAYTVSTGGRGGNVYVVEDGDTLFNIARQELGKAARWAEIYALNRDILGDDIDFVSPGMELVLPDDGAARSDTFTQRPTRRIQR